MALARRVGRSVQRWMPHLARVRNGLRQVRDQWLRPALAEELERSRRDNEQLQKLLAELPEIFERKYQQRLEPLLEHQYRLLEDNALLMDQLRLLQSRSAPGMLQLASVDSRATGPIPATTSLDLAPPTMASDPFAAIPPQPETQAFPTAAEKESVTLEGNASLADVQTLLHSPPWGALGPSLMERREGPGAPPPPEEPATMRAAPADAPTTQPSFQDLVSLASQEVQNGEIAANPVVPQPPAAMPFGTREPEALIEPEPEPEPVRAVQPPSTPAPSPWLPIESRGAAVAPVPIATDRPSVIGSEAAGPALWQAEPPFISPIATDSAGITAAAASASQTLPSSNEALSTASAATPESAEDLDPLEQARARRLQAWRRSRQQQRD